MNLEVRTYQDTDEQWYFDVVDLGDVWEGMPELVYSDGVGYKKEQTAERNGRKWIKEFGEEPSYVRASRTIY